MNRSSDRLNFCLSGLKGAEERKNFIVQSKNESRSNVKLPLFLYPRMRYVSSVIKIVLFVQYFLFSLALIRTSRPNTNPLILND